MLLNRVPLTVYRVPHKFLTVNGTLFTVNEKQVNYDYKIY